MTCTEQNKILMFDQLSSEEQDQLLHHVEHCLDCQNYFDKYISLEKGLSSILDDIDLSVNSIRKASTKRMFKRALLACASLFLIILSVWNTPHVKAAIEKAINDVIIDYFHENEQPIESINKEKEIITYAKVHYPDLGLTEIYAKDKHVRMVFENGDFIISDGKYYASYSKKDNLFHISELAQNSLEPIISYFNDLDPNNMKFIGEKQYLNRSIEVYLVNESEGIQTEYWFDKETKLFLRSIQLVDGKRDESSDVKQFKVVEVEKGHKLFDFIAPDGATIVDESSQ
ncbi:LolA family protein [Metabacillus malikii]|uniref:Uncharacterized protein n=1 Tax=Metabacillus malikii TaxID=1504265 RepID=A0ABT9ZJP9_9BACI|nr:hypothetical protein [Metabacillus malikii]MDQ0232487.1 hypothetical protein [Metabacillus malikii]